MRVVGGATGFKLSTVTCLGVKVAAEVLLL